MYQTLRIKRKISSLLTRRSQLEKEISISVMQSDECQGTKEMHFTGAFLVKVEGSQDVTVGGDDGIENPTGKVRLRHEGRVSTIS